VCSMAKSTGHPKMEDGVRSTIKLEPNVLSAATRGEHAAAA